MKTIIKKKSADVKAKAVNQKKTAQCCAKTSVVAVGCHD